MTFQEFQHYAELMKEIEDEFEQYGEIERKSCHIGFIG